MLYAGVTGLTGLAAGATAQQTSPTTTAMASHRLNCFRFLNMTFTPCLRLGPRTRMKTPSARAREP